MQRELGAIVTGSTSGIDLSSNFNAIKAELPGMKRRNRGAARVGFGTCVGTVLSAKAASRSQAGERQRAGVRPFPPHPAAAPPSGRIDPDQDAVWLP